MEHKRLPLRVAVPHDDGRVVPLAVRRAELAAREQRARARDRERRDVHVVAAQELLRVRVADVAHDDDRAHRLDERVRQPRQRDERAQVRAGEADHVLELEQPAVLVVVALQAAGRARLVVHHARAVVADRVLRRPEQVVAQRLAPRRERLAARRHGQRARVSNSAAERGSFRAPFFGRAQASAHSSPEHSFLCLARGARDLLLEAHAPQLLGVAYLRPSCSPMIAIARGLARFLDAIQPPVGDFPGFWR